MILTSKVFKVMIRLH